MKGSSIKNIFSAINLQHGSLKYRWLRVFSKKCISTVVHLPDYQHDSKRTRNFTHFEKKVLFCFHFLIQTFSSFFSRLSNLTKGVFWSKIDKNIYKQFLLPSLHLFFHSLSLSIVYALFLRKSFI